MIDPLISLAYSMQSNKGVYALLIGSGVSRSAGIPTGWEIVLDLVNKLAKLHGVSGTGDSLEWYRKKYDKEPDYSELLESLARTPEERQAILAGYFEPNADEREQGLKLPTAAHKAITKLVSSGYIRVIVTTNFDRLLERAIQDEGITPTVLSTPDMVGGTLPLIHQRCTVFKIHGDYLDPRIKNISNELESYDPRTNQLLDQVLDQFGMVVAGWSGEWDTALLSAFHRCPSRRFTTYWAARGELNNRAKHLVNARGGVVVPIEDADKFFVDLSEKVFTLESLQQPHPLSVASAAASVKRFVAEDRYLIRFHDLVQQETEKTRDQLLEVFDWHQQHGITMKHLLDDFSSRMQILLSIAVHGAFWGKREHRRDLGSITSRLTSARSGDLSSKEVQLLPSLVALYSMGIAALANDNTEILVDVLLKPEVTSQNRGSSYAAAINWNKIQRTLDEWMKLYNTSRLYGFPASEWLFTACRPALRGLIPDDLLYDRLFDRFEIVRSLFCLCVVYNSETNLAVTQGDVRGLCGGRFVSKRANTNYGDELSVMRSDTVFWKRLMSLDPFTRWGGREVALLEKFAARVLEVSLSLQ